MRVLIWATGVDTGGQGHRIGQGFAKHAPEWTVDVLNNAASALGYPETSQSPGHRRIAARDLYAKADVVHLRNNLDGWRQLGQGKPIVLHHHGSLFRGAHGGIAQQARAIGAVQIASTLDLTLLEPDVEWLPAPYDLDSLMAIRQANYVPSESVRIAHFPTSAKVKSTAAFLAATERLSERYPIEVLTNVRQGKVRHMPWADVLAQKATADIYFDQVQLGYGNNAVEAWGMGIPVVAGIADPAVRALMVERFGPILPFVNANEETIGTALEYLIGSPDRRAEWAARGLAHVKRFHDDAVVVAQLQRIYASAQPTRSVTLPRREPSWLVQRRRAKVAA